MSTTTPQMPKMPTSDNKASQAINLTNAILVGLIALGSFALSYSNLRQVALEYGITGSLSYVWPFLLDGALVVFSLSVVSAYLRSESTWRQWALVILYTVATIGFNILHAPGSLLAQVVPKGLVSLVVAMVAPVSLFFGFEMLMSQFKSQIVRQNKMLSLTELDKLVADKRTEVDKKLSEMDNEIETKRTETDKKLSELDKMTQDKNAELDKTQNALDKKLSALDKAQIELDRILSKIQTETDNLADKNGGAVDNLDNLDNLADKTESPLDKMTDKKIVTPDKMRDKINAARTKREQRQAEAIRLFDSGVSIPDIAKQFKVNQRTIKRYLNGQLEVKSEK